MKDSRYETESAAELGPLTRLGLSPETRDDRESAVQAGVLEVVFRHVPASLLGDLAGAACVVLVLWNHGPRHWLAAWFCLVVVEAGLRLRAARGFTVDPDRVERIALWSKRWVGLAALNGLAWGMAGFAFFPSDHPVQQLVLLTVVQGVSLGSLFLYAGSRRAFDVFLALALGPLVIRLSMESDPIYLSAAAVLLVIFGFAMLFGRRFGVTVRESVKNNVENDVLVEQLLAEKRIAEEARRSAENATRSRSQFFAAASHDLRQPLQAIGIYLTLLRKRAGEAALPMVENLSGAVDSLSKLVEELLEISRLDAGAIRPRIEQIALDELFLTLEREFAPIAGARGIDLRIRPLSRTVQSDPTLLLRVVRNLLANAIRYTSRGGVLLAARARPGGRVAIEVWDTGPGIAPVEVERIFEEFYRGESAKSQGSASGFGLGLSIVKRICGLLKLPLELSSRPGRGTVFRVELPAEFAPRRLARTTPQAGQWLLRPLNGATIALIEDNPEILNSLSRLLRSWGALVVAAQGYDAGLIQSLARHPRIDVILADHNLGPESPSGVETVFRLREILGHPVPAVMLTAVSASEVLADYSRVMRERLALSPMLAGAISPHRLEEPIVLQKPTTPAVLNNAIVVQLGGAGTRPVGSQATS